MTPTYFKSPAEFRRWLVKNHSTVQELWVGFHKKGTGKASITWPESVDEALCFGWIDGVRKSVDEDSYTIRFTPRRLKSIWSKVNTKRFAELIKEGRVQTDGLKAFEARDEKRSGVYSFENRLTLDKSYEKQFRANKKAWAFFSGKAPWYQRTAGHWIMSAKKEETRLRRLESLIAASEQGKDISVLARPEKKG
jgi:uncharacterized protein YdeI (YjbR/CyaY-like superfamily)